MPSHPKSALAKQNIYMEVLCVGSRHVFRNMSVCPGHNVTELIFSDC